MKSFLKPSPFIWLQSGSLWTSLLLAGGTAVSSAAPQLYDFNSPLPAGLSIFGSAVLAESGSYDNSGYLSLTDAAGSLSGGIRFPSPSTTLDQIHVKFKARIADGTQADGFSFTVSPDLPAATSSGESGYKPTVADPPRFIVAFDTYNNGGGDFVGISVILNGKTIADIPTGVDLIPPLYSDTGEWVDVDINLKRSGKLSLSWAGVVLLDNVPTGFDGIDNARIGLDARTGTNFETHWFDDISFDFTEGDGGPLVIGAESDLASRTVAESSPVTFAAVPGGTGPFTYQWSRNGTAIPGETRRTLKLPGKLTDAASYSVTVSNGAGGSVTSTPAVLTVTPDLTAPQLVSTEAAAGTVNRIVLTFNELLDPVSATALSTYNAGTLAILSATLTADGKGVILKTAQQLSRQSYTLTITGLRDASAAGNAATASTPFTGKASYRGEVLADTPVRYWQFEETEGFSAVSSASGLNTDAAALTATFQSGEFTGTTPGLVASLTGSKALVLAAENFQYLLVPSATDINTGGPYPKKTIELWIKPASIPSPDTNGAETAGLWEEGGADRGLNVYLWHNPENTDLETASLVFHSFNRLSDGPGSPYGLDTLPALFAEYPGIRAGQTYHIVAVQDGDATGTTGSLILYVNGQEVKRSPGSGQIYAHGSDVRIGQGNGRIHTNVSGELAPFDGIIDEVSYYNTALSADRVSAHYFIGIGAPAGGSVGIDPASDLLAKSTPENTPVQFGVTPTGTGPFTYQWYRNGTPLTGETARTLLLAGTAAQAGSYTVKVSNGVNETLSAPAVLTVIPDLTPAALVSVSGIAGSLNQILLNFNDAVDPITATSPSTYSIPGLTVLAAVVGADGKSVALHTSAQEKGKSYAVTISGLKDTSAAGNPLTASASFTSVWDYSYDVLADSPVRYWRFDETLPDEASGLASAVSLPLGSGNAASLIAAWRSADGSLPTLGAPGLLGTNATGTAVSLLRSAAQWGLVPNHADINSGVHEKRTVEVWFKAASVPAPDTTGVDSIAGIWEEGGTGRSLNLYLWRDPANPNPDEAELVFHAFNNANDGPGSPWGLPGTSPIWTHATIKAGQTYHVAGVLEGDRSGFAGNLILYVNGVAVATAPGVGTLYGHGSDVRIGQGNSWYHEGSKGDVGSFDGVLDELAVYNSALPADRVVSHYQNGSVPSEPATGSPVIENLRLQNGFLVLNWSGTGILQRADTPAGPWTDINGATSPYTESAAGVTRRFFRLIVR